LKGFDEYVEDLAGAALLPGLSFMLQPVMPATLNRIAATPATCITRYDGGLLTCAFILTAFLGSAAQSMLIAMPGRKEAEISVRKAPASLRNRELTHSWFQRPIIVISNYPPLLKTFSALAY
jgi:hypothetical protein